MERFYYGKAINEFVAEDNTSIFGLEFTHFLNAKVHFTPINKG